MIEIPPVFLGLFRKEGMSQIQGYIEQVQEAQKALEAALGASGLLLESATRTYDAIIAEMNRSLDSI